MGIIYRGYYIGTGMNRRWLQRLLNYLAAVRYREREVTQGDLTLLKISNIVVDAVVREFLLEVCGTQ